MAMVNAQCGQTVRIGFETENKRTQVRFDLSDIMAEFPGGTAVLTIRRPGDEEATVSTSVTMDGTALVWNVTAWECERRGFLYAQVIYAVGDVVAKTKIYRFQVNESLMGEADEPEGWEDWVDELVEAAADTRAAVESYDEMTAAATGLPAGSTPTAVIDRTGENPVLELGIPAGNDGYTPQRGTDYWTEEDQAAMRQDIADDLTAARQAINDEKVLAVGAVETAGTTQVGLVTDEGTAQKAAVVAQGQATIASIPSDYTTLSNDVDDLKSAFDSFACRYYTGHNVVSGTTILTNSQASAGTKIYYDLTALSGKAGYISINDTNGDRITYFGKGSSGLSENHYSGEYILPNDFGSITTAGSGNLASCFIAYEPDYYEIAENNKEFNLFDSKFITTGKRGNVSDLIIENSSDWFVTDYIPVSPGDTIQINWYVATPYYGHLWYDENLEAISGTLVTEANKTFTVPDNGAKFVRITGKTEIAQTAKIHYVGIVKDVVYTLAGTATYINSNTLNSFDKNNVLLNYRGVVDTVSRIEGGEGYFVTYPIPIKGIKKIRVNWYLATAYYGHLWLDGDRKILSGTLMTEANMLMDVPFDAEYVMLCGQTANINNCCVYLYNAMGFVPNTSGAPLAWNNLNLLDKNTITDNYSVSSSSGALNPDSGYYATDFIRVTEGDTISVNQIVTSPRGIAWYDYNKNYLSAQVGSALSYTVPTNASYARFTGVKAIINDMMITTNGVIRQIIGIQEKGESLYKRVVLKNTRQTIDGYTYAAFPSMCFAQDKIVIGYRVSSEHTTPTDPSKWGGIVFDTCNADGIWSHSGVIKGSDYNFDGELRDAHLTVSRDGQYILLSGFTTDENDDHENYMFVLDMDLEVQNYYKGSDPDCLWWGNTIQTPNGYLLQCGYKAGVAYIMKSNQIFSGSVASMTFSVVKTISVSDQTLSEATLGYHKSKLFCLIRNDSGNQQSYCMSTSDTEGTTGWSEPIPFGEKIHAPTLLPHTNKEYLVYAGAKYESAQKRLPTIGYIDPATCLSVSCGVVDRDVNGYSGYCGLVPFGGDEYGMAYYEDIGTTAMYYKRLNTRYYCAEMSYLD